ncbi:hypothetical protein C8R43DRAFT_957810 [Mycena crocata]|nr:hypothetical protein C8R43DRAFT_957810 [Mycena crocata]
MSVFSGLVNELADLRNETRENVAQTEKSKDRVVRLQNQLDQQDKELSELRAALLPPPPKAATKRKAHEPDVDENGFELRKPLHPDLPSKPAKKPKKVAEQAVQRPPAQGAFSGQKRALQEPPLPAKVYRVSTTTSTTTLLTMQKLIPIGKRPAPKTPMLTVYDSSAKTQDLIDSERRLRETLASYDKIMEGRRDDAQKERDESAKTLQDTLATESETDALRQTKAAEIQSLHGQLNATLGETQYNKLMQARALAGKARATAPKKMQGVDKTSRKEYIQHLTLEGLSAEGSGAPGARAAAKKKQKIRGGGGYDDEKPDARTIWM